jgi:hypothetical protein
MSGTKGLASGKHVPGISLRDWLAGQVASGIAAHSGVGPFDLSPSQVAEWSYLVADAMLIERERSQ